MINLTVFNTSISINASGLYSLNDLHNASGAEKSQRPSFFLQTDKTQAYINVLRTKEPDDSHDRIFQIKKGSAGGTWGSKKLLCRYASWLSPEIDEMVHSAFIEKVEQQHTLSPAEQNLAHAKMMVEHERQLAQLPVIQKKIESMEDKIDHYDYIFHHGEYTSVKAFSNAFGINIDVKKASKLGKRCTKYCEANGVEIRSFPCPVFHTVNGYPSHIVREVFAEFGLI